MKPRPLGVTLVELLITIAMIAILLGLGAPMMRELVQNNCQATQINDMLVSLNLARASAVKHGADAVVCISDGGVSPDCMVNATRWENGWLVFIDGNQSGASKGSLDNPHDTDGNLAWDAGEDWPLEVHTALECGTTLRGNANVADSIDYNPRGFSGTAGTLTLCDERGATEARGIVISNTGHPRLATDTNGDGIADVSGNNLACP